MHESQLKLKSSFEHGNEASDLKVKIKMLSFCSACGLDLIILCVCFWLQYLILVFVIIVFLLADQCVAVVLAFGIESIDDYLLGAFNLSPTERTTLETNKYFDLYFKLVKNHVGFNSLVPRSPLAMPLNMECTANDHMARF